MDVARAFRSGHIGSTPQPTDTILAGSRVQGMLQDFSDHLEPNPRVDAYMGVPSVLQAAEPGYFRDQSTSAHIDQAILEAAFAPHEPTGKTLGGPNLFGDA